MGGPPIEKEGWLEKEGAQVKNWKRRWFVLQGTSLHYFKDPGVRPSAREARHARAADAKRRVAMGLPGPHTPLGHPGHQAAGHD